MIIIVCFIVIGVFGGFYIVQNTVNLDLSQ